FSAPALSSIYSLSLHDALPISPLLWGDFISSIAATLPQFVWSKSPPRTFEFSGTTLFRIAGGFFVVLAILCFIFFRGGNETQTQDRKSTRLNSSHRTISYAVFC